MDGGELLELHCPICYGDQGDSGYATLICGHIFHEKCLTQSLRIKKECPSCRCPARPLDTGRRDASSQPKCPCKTGQPLRLFHLQRPRSGADGAPSPGGAGAGAIGGLGSAVDSSILAAAEQRAAQRESRLREALQEERRKALELEVELAKQLEELVKAQEKAERRKQRLAAMERDHQLALARLAEDTSRLEGRERELSEELTRLRQALHGTRMELEKARTAVYERDDAVMRLKRELALQRARTGGSAAMQPREIAELLGERKEDWQVVYSMKVEELRRAMEVTAELRAELARGKTEADARVAAERLAGAERLKAVASERDEAKRELMELEYKLHEAQRRLSELQSAEGGGGGGGRPSLSRPSGVGMGVAAGAGSVPPSSSRAAAALRPPTLPTVGLQQQQQQQQQRTAQESGSGSRRSGAHLPQPQQRSGAAAANRGGVGGGSRPVTAPGVSGAAGSGVREDIATAVVIGDDDGEDGDLEALAMEALGCWDDERHEAGERRGAGGAADGEAEDEAVDEGQGSGLRVTGLGSGRVEGRTHPTSTLTFRDGGNDGGQDDGDDDLAGDSTPYEMTDATEVVLPPSKRQRYGSGAGGAADGHADGGDLQMYDGGGELIDDEEPVPRLPGAFSGLFAGGGALGRPQHCPGGVGVKAGGLASSGGPGGGTAFGLSFAAKVDGARGSQGRSARAGLVGDGPDGRGGTARFPLTSSFAHNAGARKAAAPGKGTARGGGNTRGGSSTPQGRIDAFLRPLPQRPPGR